MEAADTSRALTVVSAPTEPEAEAYIPDLAALKRMFEDSQTLTQEGRKDSLFDIDLYDGNHLTRAEKAALASRKQPDNVFNLTRLAVNGTLGVIKQGSTDPRAFPRNPQDEDSADVASKTLRYIADKNSFDALKVDAAKDFLVPGTCAAITEADEDGQVTVSQIRWEEFFHDPFSRRQDFRDARYMGAARWMYADDVSSMYPEKKDDVARSVSTGSNSAVDLTFNDRPESGTTVSWVDSKRRRIMVVEIYHLEQGKWRRSVYHNGGLLESADSPYHDAKGRPCNPIEAQSCYVDKDNNRLGIVRDMRGPQSEVNKRHSKLLHLLNSRQVQESAPGMGHGTAADAAKEAAKPDGAIPPGWQVVQNGDMARGQAEMLQEAKSFLERFAPNPAMLGRADQARSGRSKQVDQQAGLTELAIVFGGVEEWELRIYRQMWNRARQFMKAPDWVRVTDDEGAPDFVGINQPVHEMEPVLHPATGEQQIDPNTGQPAEQPKMYPTIQQGGGVAQQPRVLGYSNALAELDVDIVLDTTPDTANLQAEQFSVLAELAKMYPQDVSFDDLLELSTMPNKRPLIEKRKARMEERSRQPPPPEVKAKVDNLNADTELKLATAFHKVKSGGAQGGPPLPADAVPPEGPPPGPPMQDQGPPPAAQFG